MDAGYDADELLDKTQRQDIKDQLRANTDRWAVHDGCSDKRRFCSQYLRDLKKITPIELPIQNI